MDDKFIFAGIGVRWCVMLAAALVVVFEALEQFPKWKSKKWSGKFFLIYKLITVVFLGYYSVIDWVISREEKNIDATHFPIKYKNEGKIYPRIGLGSKNASFINKEEVGLYENGHTLAKVWVEDEKLKLDVNIIESNGSEYIASIKGRTCHMYKSNYQYNNDDYGFEITTISGRVIFQADFQDSLVVISGLFYSKKGDAVLIYPYQNSGCILTIKNDSIGDSIDYNHTKLIPFNPEEFVIEPLFKYPREENLGVRIKR